MTNWLITEVEKGLGRALALAALRRGDRVVGTVGDEAAVPLFEEIAPGRATGLVLDLTRQGDASQCVAAAERRLGYIDRLVNCAVVNMVAPVELSGIDQMRALFEGNVFGQIAMIQAVLPDMRQRRSGQIVTINTLGMGMPLAGLGAYGAGAHALDYITQTLAREVRSLGIHVTSIIPGLMDMDWGIVPGDTAWRDIADYAAFSEVRTEASEELTVRISRAAQAILTALDAREPPRHLFLGEQALTNAGTHMAQIADEMDKWKAVSLSVDYG